MALSMQLATCLMALGLMAYDQVKCCCACCWGLCVRIGLVFGSEPFFGGLMAKIKCSVCTIVLGVAFVAMNDVVSDLIFLACKMFAAQWWWWWWWWWVMVVMMLLFKAFG